MSKSSHLDKQGEETQLSPSRTQQIIDLEKKPVGKLLTQLSLPLVFGMLVQGLYNVVDAAFVSHGVGAMAVGGVSIVFPIQIFMFAVAVLIGHGAASIITRLLGAGRFDEANRLAGNTIALGLFIAVCLTVTIFLFMDGLLGALTKSDVLLPYAKEYLQPLVFGMVFVFLSSNLSDMLRSEGKMKNLMVINIASALVNVVLDAIFIFGLDMGVKGAAYATVIAQILAMCLALTFIFRGSTQLKIVWQKMGFRLDETIEIFKLGFPVFLGHLGFSITIAAANYVLANSKIDDADLQISAYGIIGRTFVFIMLPLIGFVTSFRTIVGYNYGAELKERVSKSIKLGLMVSTIFTLAIAALMIGKPELIVAIFSDDVALIQAASAISKVMFLGWPTISVFMIVSSYFQAVGKAGMAFILPLVRVYILLVPGLLLIPMFVGIDYIWYAYPLADGVSFIFILLLLGVNKRKAKASGRNEKVFGTKERRDQETGQVPVQD